MAFRITVEPVLLFHMLAVFMLLPALQDLIYVKVCMNTYTPKVCDQLYSPENIAALDAVQSGSSHWILASTLMLSLPSIFSAQFIGSWSDAYGTKIPMLIPPIGSVFGSLVYIGQSVFITHWSVSLVILAAFITGICGSFSSCILTCNSYITQVSSVSSRTWRLSILEAMILIGASAGPALSGLIQESIGRAAVFTTIMAIHTIVVIYIILFVRNILPRHPPQVSWKKGAFNCKHLYDCVQTAVRVRQENRRTFILLLFLIASFVMFATMGEIDISYLFVKDIPLQWSISTFTKYLSMKSFLGASALFCLRLFKWLPDTILLVIGLISKSAGLFLLGFSSSTAMVFSSGVISSLRTWSLPTIRSSLSKLVEPGEQGKIFACVALLENACSLVASGLFNSLYPVTRTFFKGFLFILAASLLIVAIGVSGFVHRSLKAFSLYGQVEEVEAVLENTEEIEGCQVENETSTQSSESQEHADNHTAMSPEVR